MGPITRWRVGISPIFTVLFRGEQARVVRYCFWLGEKEEQAGRLFHSVSDMDLTTRKEADLIMRMLVGMLCLLWAADSLRAETLVEQLIERYEQVESVTCDVRRDVSNEDGRLRWLSRVYYQRPDRLHVENHAPLQRRIIADGETMYQYNDGQPRGFRRALAELDERMLQGLSKVPGTAMEHLYRLQGLAEVELAGEGAYPIRRGYETERLFVVLHADDAYRLGRIELYESSDRTRLAVEIDFDAFEEVVDGVWIPMRHQSRSVLGAIEVRETTRFSNFSANEPIPQHLFNAAAFFSDVQWVDQFEDL